MGAGYPEGFTIRDWYAGQALAGMLSNSIVYETAQALSENDSEAGNTSSIVAAALIIGNLAVKLRDAIPEDALPPGWEEDEVSRG